MAEGLPELDGMMDEKINELVKSLKPETSTRLPTIVVLFLDKDPFKSKKKSGWFGQTKSHEDLKLWEQWTISVNCVFNERDSPNTKPLAMMEPQDLKVSSQSFESTLTKIIDYVDTNKHHIPPITSLESCPFPYTIEVWPNGDQESTDPHQPPHHPDDTWGNYIKKMLD